MKRINVPRFFRYVERRLANWLTYIDDTLSSDLAAVENERDQRHFSLHNRDSLVFLGIQSAVINRL